MTGLRDRLGPIRARLWPGAGRFLDWWARGLAAWLPAGMRRALGVGRGRLTLQAVAGEIVLGRDQDGALRELGRIPAHDPAVVVATPAIAGDADPLGRLLAPRLAELPRWLLLPASSCLRRRLVLPAAAADRLRDVVGFEVDRQTPFDVADVAYDARLLGRRERDGQLDVELVVVPRSALAPQLAALGALADGLAGIDVAGEDGQPIGVNLLPPEQRRQQRDPWRVWNWGLATLAVLATGLMLWQVLQNRRAAAEAFEARIADQAAAGRQAAEKRQRLVSLIEGQAFLDATRAKRPTSVEVIDELTRRLPDNTYLEKLSLEDQRMMLIGLSSEAPALISRLQGAPYWRSPALAGALQPDPTSGRDRFTLTAELANTAPPAGAASPPPSPAAPSVPAPAPAPTKQEAVDDAG
ncbi:PilN domain-containing protein [Marilutibacter spongiae]|uniref:PilN domain-containing protein n=1 Tax=Marilutibacter spongiae TaxID=2025720 RepID=A0A7W3TIQ6_9GAMM|nr:PilN domain-containing protein [Lysobacter spongiae]MBB1059075.1 PilN domain-containing protein [Lysobacter spongiae]